MTRPSHHPFRSEQAKAELQAFYLRKAMAWPSRPRPGLSRLHPRRPSFGRAAALQSLQVVNIGLDIRTCQQLAVSGNNCVAGVGQIVAQADKMRVEIR